MHNQEVNINPIQNGHFRGSSRMEGGSKNGSLSKICRTYPTMMRLGTVIPYPKRIHELRVYESRDTPIEVFDISIFSTQISLFCYLKKYRYRLYFDT